MEAITEQRALCSVLTFEILILFTSPILYYTNWLQQIFIYIEYSK